MNTARYLRTGMLAALLLWAGAAFGEEVPDAEIAKLIEQLGDDDFDVRTEATSRLIAIGDAGWPAVQKALEDKDEERAERARKIAPLIGRFTPQQAERVKELTLKLYDREDEMARAAGLDGFLELGYPGIRFLRENLSGLGAKPSVRIEIDRRTFTLGEKIAGKASLWNQGTAPYWHEIQNRPLRWDIKSAPFGECRPSFGMCRGGGRRLLVRRGGYYNPIRSWKCTPPDMLTDEILIEEEASSLGVYRGAAEASLPEPKVIAPRVPGKGDETVPLGIGAGIAETRASQSVTLFVLPDLKKVKPDQALNFEVAKPDVGTAGETLSVAVTLKPRAAKDDLLVEAGFLRYAWYALLDGGGTPVKWGSWQSVTEKSGDESEVPADAFTIAAGTDRRERLNIIMPEAAGEFTLLLGYEISPEKFRLDTIPDSTGERHTEPVPGRFDNASIYATTPISVTAPKKK